MFLSTCCGVKTSVRDVRQQNPKTPVVRRRRVCEECGRVFTTREIPDEDWKALRAQARSLVEIRERLGSLLGGEVKDKIVT